MAEEFHGGVCGGVWWNPPQSLFSSGGGGGGLWSMCSISQLDNGDDDGDGGHETINLKDDNSYVCDTMNSMIFSSDLDSTFDSFGFGFSPTSSSTHWNQSHLFYNEGDELIIKEDVNTTVYEIKSNNLMIDNNLAQQGSPPMELTTVSSNSSEDSSSMNNEFISNINTNFPMSSSTSYLIRTLFDDDNDLQLIDPTNETPMSSINQDVNDIALRNIQVSSLNSLQPRSKLKKKSNSCANNLVTKVANEEVCDSNGNLNDQPLAKRPRIGTPSQLPTFKVRKEKLGDRITALQQLVSPFGKTDTASVLHEAIEYIKYLHNQVNDFNNLKNKKEHGKDLRSKGLCVMPITSTYPIAQETPVDFWTPNFGTIPLL